MFEGGSNRFDQGKNKGRKDVAGIETPSTIFSVDNLKKYFSLQSGLFGGIFGKGKKIVKAIDGVSFSIERGEFVGLVGESGSGKTTLGEILVKLQEPSEGKILLGAREITHLTGKDLTKFRREAQMIFQDPYETLNPRFTIYETVCEPLKIHRIGGDHEKVERVIEALERAELRPGKDFLDRYPHELSGGQRQRVSISRAIVLEPKFIVADEPVSMLDVSIRAGILNLLMNLNSKLGVTLIYVSHDLTTVKYICQRTMIMYLGKIVECGETSQILNSPLHPYTKALILSVPRIDLKASRKRADIRGEMSDAIDLPSGCRFHPRCLQVQERCRDVEPSLIDHNGKHQVACHLYDR
jgi:peptide/nickel transport system ATP-binding protein